MTFNTQDPQWSTVAHQILVACRPLSYRVEAEGVKLMLTDTDWAVLQGFEIVSQRTVEIEFLGLCVAAGLTRKNVDALIDLYNFRKKS